MPSAIKLTPHTRTVKLKLFDCGPPDRGQSQYVCIAGCRNRLRFVHSHHKTCESNKCAVRSRAGEKTSWKTITGKHSVCLL